MLREADKPELTNVGDYYYKLGLLAMVERWQDEASEAALSNNPRRAGYIEHMVVQVPRISGVA